MPITDIGLIKQYVILSNKFINYLHILFDKPVTIMMIISFHFYLDIVASIALYVSTGFSLFVIERPTTM